MVLSILQSWADKIPCLYLYLVYLSTYISYFHLRAPWQIPWILQPYNQNTDAQTSVSISENLFYQFSSREFLIERCCGSSYGWLAVVDRRPKISLFNLLADKKILPKLTELSDIQDFQENHEEYAYQDCRGFQHQHTVDTELGLLC